MSNLIRKGVVVSGLIIALIFLGSQPVLCQQSGPLTKQQETIDVSDQELKEFIKVQNKLAVIQDSARQEMVAAIKGAGLDVKSFNKISKQMQGAQSMEDVDASADKVKKVQKAAGKVQSIQRSMQQKQQQTINNEKMSLQRFQEIRQAAMQDRKLLQRMQLMKNKNE
mgnify:CR=1 FL=1